MMYCIALTGNIASGKSTISAIFKAMGIRVINADDVARELTAIGQPALTLITNHIGPSVLDSSGALNRALLRQMIFSDETLRTWLENLLHPLIRRRIHDSIQEPTGPYSIIEIPLLKNRCDYPYLDRVLLVLVEQEQLIKRIMLRDNNDHSLAKTILASQADESTQRKLADDIIYNEGSIAQLEKKIKNLHQQYLQFAGQKS